MQHISSLNNANQKEKYFSANNTHPRGWQESMIFFLCHYWNSLGGPYVHMYHGQVRQESKWRPITTLHLQLGEVQVPPLQMVDDVISASKCGAQVVATNAAVNMLIKLKKLLLSETKCSRLHIGQSKCGQCPKISANESDIKEPYKEKYLGDYINSKANASTTLQDRKRKGNGILADIRAILEKIPLGNRRLEYWPLTKGGMVY